jgi:OPT oligopeptide transporter protein
LLGVALVIVVELLGIRSLTFAVGAYLSIATTLAIFIGGVMRWMVDRALEKHRLANPIPGDELASEEISPGSLYASGLIAAGGIVGLLGVCAQLAESLSEEHGGHWKLFQFSNQNPMYHEWVGVVMFALLAFSLYYFARKPLDQPKP